MKLHSLKIKDELHDRFSLSPQYLACSVLKDGTDACSLTCDPVGGELRSIGLEEEDIFNDAMSDFTTTPTHSFYSQALDMPFNTRHSTSDVPECSVTVDIADALLYDKELEKGKCLTSEIFYEAQNNDMSDFVVVTFLTRHPGSSHYDGVDTQVRVNGMLWCYVLPLQGPRLYVVCVLLLNILLPYFFLFCSM